MGAGTKVVIATLIGMLCGAAWVSSLQPATDLMCGGEGLDCLGAFMLMLPVMIVVWLLIGWGLLKMARFDPAWPTGIGGPVGTVLVSMLVGFVTDLVGVEIPLGGGVAAFAVITGVGYALAAVVTARYGGLRDGVEHRGQDR